jgi:CDP-6-deoxy-D-xylo-4-hexulose-3-dehydrase
MFVNTGFNVRPTEINAAIGSHQLRKLESFNRRRDEIAQQWRELLRPCIEAGQLTPMAPTPGTGCTWFGFPVTCASTTSRDALQAHLEKSGIETRPIIAGNLARQPAFQHVKHRISGRLAGADEIMDRGLFWGSHPLMTTEDVNYVGTTVRKFFEK